ncbi:MAG: diguanylate cyclase [Acidobacteria bacterium]|nr:diguanylate cyclase [Acidobacteriota bacterium]
MEKKLSITSGKEKVRLQLELAGKYHFRSPQRVLELATKAYAEAIKHNWNKLAAQALLAQGTGYYYNSELEKSEKAYKNALAAGKAMKMPLVIGGALNGIGVVALSRGKTDAALKFMEDSLPYLKKAGVKSKLAAIYNNVSVIYYNRGRFSTALDNISKALKLYEETDNKAGICIALNAIGNIQIKLSRIDAGLASFRKSLKISRETGNPQLELISLINVGDVERKQGHIKEALKNFRAALELAKENKNRDYTGVCLNNIGDAYRSLGMYKKALRNYLEALTIFEELKAKPRISFALANIGQLYALRRQPQKAETYLLKAYRMSKEIQDQNRLKDTTESLYRLYEKQHRYKEALKFRNEFDKIKNKQMSAQAYEKISQLEARHEKEKRQKEIQLLKKEQEIRDERIRHQQVTLTLVVIATILALVLLMTLYRRYKLKVKSSKELEKAFQKMEELAGTDQLTGLYNRRSFLERVEIETVRMGRTWKPFSFIMLDIDNFKTINDTFGHECGDTVLKALAKALKNSLRLQDVSARWGGEEFLLLLPDTGIQGAFRLAEKIRRNIESIRVSCNGDTIRFTVSAGVSSYDHPGAIDSVIRKADEALYLAKKSGKNCVKQTT